MLQSIQFNGSPFSQSMQSRPFLFVLALATASSFATVTTAKQQLAATDSSTDGGPQLRVSTPKSTYRQGELIPLDLAFTAKDDNRYQINMATYDRSGRMPYESFHVDPANGTSDPLGVYFKSQEMFMGGGLTNYQFLSDTPYVVHLDLNEWVRFDKPGSYRVIVESSRVGSKRRDRPPFGKQRELLSNAIDIQIVVPDPAWEESELDKILAEFDASPAPKHGFSSDERLAAATKLRYLGSADAAREMARHLRGDENQVDWDCMFGLIGSPNKQAGLAEMKRLLVDPDFPVDGMFLDTMAMLPLNAQTDAESLRQTRESYFNEARTTLAAALPSKRGQALAKSTDTLNQRPRNLQ